MGVALFIMNKRLPAIRVRIRSGVRLFGMKDGSAAAQADFEGDRRSKRANAVIVTAPGGVVDEEEAD